MFPTVVLFSLRGLELAQPGRDGHTFSCSVLPIKQQNRIVQLRRPCAGAEMIYVWLSAWELETSRLDYCMLERGKSVSRDALLPDLPTYRMWLFFFLFHPAGFFLTCNAVPSFNRSAVTIVLQFPEFEIKRAFPLPLRILFPFFLIPSILIVRRDVVEKYPWQWKWGLFYMQWQCR